VKLLLDTHVLLWWLRDDPKLGAKTRTAIEDPRTELLVSIASFWELAIKARNGKIEESGARLIDEARDRGINILAVNASHLAALETLERVMGHNDPFDHLIIAQARAEHALLITSDKQVRLYGASARDG
jgi:PIN domain nuclease of toxin-antitoxin system